MSSRQPEKENYGPEAMLRVLENCGRGDGPLASALREYFKSPRQGSIAIGPTFWGPEDGGGDSHGEGLVGDPVLCDPIDPEDVTAGPGGEK
jgi:hypothetical protein